MKYLKFFENSDGSMGKEQDTYEYKETIGRLLHLYGAIPLPKEKSSVVIKKIIKDSYSKLDLENKSDTNINFYYNKIHDKIRFYDYLNSLLMSKTTRGHNFEGLICGLFNGELSDNLNSKYDVIINGKKWSVKFSDTIKEKINLGGYKEILDNIKLSKMEDPEFLNMLNMIDKITLYQFLIKNINSSKKDKIKELVTLILKEGNKSVDGFIFAYHDLDNSKISMEIIYVDELIDLIMKGYILSPKVTNSWSLSLNTKYRFDGMDIFKKDILIPDISLKDLKKAWYDIKEIKWAKHIFGDYGSKIRPDVLRWIKQNNKEVGKKLLSWDNYKKIE